MRNRAKCRLCNDIVESFVPGDYVECTCGEIAVNGGTVKYMTYAKDFSNFMRIDDNGNEIDVVFKDKNDEELNGKIKHGKDELIDMLSQMALNIEKLPQHAMMEPVTHADYYSLILLLSAIFRSDLD